MKAHKHADTRFDPTTLHADRPPPSSQCSKQAAAD